MSCYTVICLIIHRYSDRMNARVFNIGTAKSGGFWLDSTGWFSPQFVAWSDRDASFWQSLVVAK